MEDVSSVLGTLEHKKEMFSNFSKKYLQKIFLIFSIFIFNRETKCYHMALIENGFKEFFLTSKGLVKKK